MNPGPSSAPTRLLVVDDSPYARLRIRRFLSGLGFPVVLEAQDGIDAVELFRTHRPGLVILDQVMRGAEGLDVAAQLKEIDPCVRLVMLTVVSDPAFEAAARSIGIEAVLSKDHLDGLEVFLRRNGRA